MDMEIVAVADRPELLDRAARWFHEKWDIPEAAYRESMLESLTGADPVPQWYLALAGERIVGGLGVIDNDFHDRKDLSPNVCAVYTEPDCRCRGIAGRLLAHVCREMSFLCMVQGEGEPAPMRMYIHRESVKKVQALF